MPATKDTIGRMLLSCYYQAVSPPNIFEGAKNIGLTYMAGKNLGEEHKFIVINEADIDHAVRSIEK